MNFTLNLLSNNIQFNVLPDHYIKGRTFNPMYLFLGELVDLNEWLASNSPCISSSNGKLRIIIKDDSLLPILPDYFMHRVSNGN